MDTNQFKRIFSLFIVSFTAFMLISNPNCKAKKVHAPRLFFYGLTAEGEREASRFLLNYLNDILEKSSSMLPEYDFITQHEWQKVSKVLDEAEGREKLESDREKEFIKFLKPDVEISGKAKIKKDRVQVTIYISKAPDYEKKNLFVIEGTPGEWEKIQNELVSNYILKLSTTNNERFISTIKELVFFSDQSDLSLYSLAVEEVNHKNCANLKILKEAYIENITVITPLLNCYRESRNDEDILTYFNNTKKLLEMKSLNVNSFYWNLIFEMAGMSEISGDSSGSVKLRKELVEKMNQANRKDSITFAEYMKDQGRFYQAIKKTTKAISSYEEAIFILESFQDQNSLRFAEASTALKALQNEDKKEMPVVSQRIEPKHKSSGDKPVDLENAELIITKGSNQKSPEKILDGLKILKSQKLENSQEYGNAQRLLADIYFEKEKYRESLDNYLAAKSIYSLNGRNNSEDYIYSLLNPIISIYSRDSRHWGVIMTIQEAMEIYKKYKLPDSRLKAELLTKAVWSKIASGENKDAIAYAENSFQILEKLYPEDLEKNNDNYILMGYINEKSNNYAKALEWYDKYKSEDGYNSYIIAGFYNRTKNYEEAIKMLKRYNRTCFKFYGRENSNCGIGLIREGDILLSQNQPAEAEKYFREAENIYSKSKDRLGLSLTQKKLAIYYHLSGDLKLTNKFIKLSELTYNYNNLDLELQVLKSRKEESGSKRRNLNFHEISVFNDYLIYADTEMQIGMILKEMKRWKEAANKLDNSRKIRSRLGFEFSQEQKQTRENLGEIFRKNLKNPCAAKIQYENAVEIAKTIKQTDLEFYTQVLEETKKECGK